MDHPSIAQGLRCGDHRSRPALFCHGAGSRRSDHRILRPISSHHTSSAGIVRCWFVTRFSTRIRRESFTATSSPRISWSRFTTASRVPKVIDFGIAKATNGQLTEQRCSRGSAQILGTPVYMSPEQAELSRPGHRHAQRHLLAGRDALRTADGHDAIRQRQLHALRYDEMRRIIREEEPPRPSTGSARCGRRGHDIARIAGARILDVSPQTVRGELDWIVMKCLEKDGNRRYETANGLARDIERYLADEPVAACPPSAGYRFRKFARRNRMLIAAVGAVGSLLVLLLVGLAASNRIIAAERMQAEKRRVSPRKGPWRSSMRAASREPRPPRPTKS